MPLGDVIAIDEGLIKNHLDKIVATTVEEMRVEAARDLL
jgi:hypothetical protein